MSELLRQTRTEIDQASGHVDSTIREQLRSIDEGLLELTDEEPSASEATPVMDDLRELSRNWLVWKSRRMGMHDTT